MMPPVLEDDEGGGGGSRREEGPERDESRKKQDGRTREDEIFLEGEWAWSRSGSAEPGVAAGAYSPF